LYLLIGRPVQMNVFAFLLACHDYIVLFFILFYTVG